MKIYNTLNNKLEEFKPISNDNTVKMYVCGPTVYNYIHIGNARPLIVFDTLARFLKYLGYKVIFVQNFTDIDDKILKKANEEKKTVKEISDRYISAFMEDIEKINISEDVIRVRVSDNIKEIENMIEKLINSKNAYISSDKEILFSIDSFKEYGALSNQKIEELANGVRIEVSETKKNPLDFVLWKPKKENEEYYQSSLGEGRPGWHIECSALIRKYLGESIDIHGGGQDLIFPHHENEIAQSVCSQSNKEFVRYWMHNAYITVNKEKMSKSLGNFLLLRDILKEYDGNILRYFILTSHYRKPQNFDIKELDIAKKTLSNLKKNLEKFSLISTENNLEVDKLLDKFMLDFDSALSDDLNTPKALASIQVLVSSANKLYKDNKEYNYAKISKLIYEKLEQILGIKLKKEEEMNEELLKILVNVREELRKNKQYELSDYIREELKKLDINV